MEKNYLLTQNEPTKSVRVRRETIMHLENGKYNSSLKLGMDIIKIFDITVEDLLNKNSKYTVN
ncbi:transcriptional regulator [Clostridioides sp. ES-S-0123-01]|nr:transcriptional regulator [Clostridioides sp. ES-S-0123-01]